MFGGSEVILHVAPALAVLGIVKPVLGLQTYSITKGISHYMYNDNTLKLPSQLNAYVQRHCQTLAPPARVVASGVS